MPNYKMTLCITLLLIIGGCHIIEDGSTAQVLDDETNGGGSDILTECEPSTAGFADAKSGQKCDFLETACGNGGVDHGSGRDIECHDGVLGVTEITVVDDAAPRDDMTWTDCAALDDGRHEEACIGVFGCYREGGQSCLEAVFCTENDAELLRVEYCDFPLPAPSEDRSVVTDCGQAHDALPNDPCDGVFLCAEGEPIEPLDTANGFGSTDEQHALNYSMHVEWCDGEVLHVLSNAFFV